MPYTITNNGSAALTYDVSVAEIYDSSYTQTWLYPAPNYSNQLTFSFNNIIDSDTLFYEIILNGAYSTTNQYYYLYLNNSYVQTFYDNDVTDYTDDTITGFITGWQLSNAITAGYFDIRLYSYNYTSVTGQTATVRVKQRKSVSWAAPVGLTTGTVTAGNSISRSLLVTVTNLALGTYNTSVIFETNDPSDPFYSVPMTVNVVSEPDMDLSTNTLNYGNVYDTQPKVDSIVVENNGCTDLSITNITSNNAHFVPGPDYPDYRCRFFCIVASDLYRDDAGNGNGYFDLLKQRQHSISNHAGECDFCACGGLPIHCSKFVYWFSKFLE